MAGFAEGGPTPVTLAKRLAELGCEVRDLSGEVPSLEGGFHVRIATNPRNGRFVILPMLEESEAIAPWVIGNIERRLGLITGFRTM